jgi:hypothetical protein
MRTVPVVRVVPLKMYIFIYSAKLRYYYRMFYKSKDNLACNLGDGGNEGSL